MFTLQSRIFILLSCSDQVFFGGRGGGLSPCLPLVGAIALSPPIPLPLLSSIAVIGNLSLNSKVDQYGFEREDDFDYETYEKFMSEYLVVLTRRAVKWDKVVDPQHRTRKSIKGIRILLINSINVAHCVGDAVSITVRRCI